MSVKVAYVVDEFKDNVATILSNDIKKGMTIPVTFDGKEHSVTVNSDIPYGHKVAIRPIKQGETIWKYGLSIGRALCDIEVGDHVHVHNIEPMRGRGDLHSEKKGCAF
ncbi:MAG: UxaA family hydrolase [Clostridia bacterium]|nr:UxaA family hydrolase [Clostridia bacterium]